MGGAQECPQRGERVLRGHAVQVELAHAVQVASGKPLPGGGVDPRRLAAYAKSGKLVIASLHDLTLAARHASRIVALKNGRLAGEGVLTSGLIAQVFDVEAEIRGEGDFATVAILRATDSRDFPKTSP